MVYDSVVKSLDKEKVQTNKSYEFSSLMISQAKPWFLHVGSTNLLKTLSEKEKLLIMSNFSFSNSVFYLFRELSAIFIKFEIVVCNFFQARRD